MAELRRHPILGEWVAVCPERPESFSERAKSPCVYCPENRHLTGSEIYVGDGRPGDGRCGSEIRVLAGSPPLFHVEGGLGKKAVGMCDCMQTVGAHEIVVETPSHSSGLECMENHEVCAVLEVLRMRCKDLAKDPRFRQITIFKFHDCNGSGDRAHPVWDVVATPFIPRAIKDELRGTRQYFAHKERCAFCDYIRQEKAAKDRVVHEDEFVVAISPYAARFPFEIWIVTSRHSPDFEAITENEKRSIAGMMQNVTAAYKSLEGCHGYSIVVHTAPVRRAERDSWQTIEQDFHWHIEMKPCLNSLNGLSDSLGFHLNSIPSEKAAQILRTT